MPPGPPFIEGSRFLHAYLEVPRSHANSECGTAVGELVTWPSLPCLIIQGTIFRKIPVSKTDWMKKANHVNILDTGIYLKCLKFF